MHMSDALLSPQIGGIMWAATVGVSAYAVKKVDLKESDYKVPLIGVMGAFVFAAQMINFAIPGTGSSGHIGGGMLLAILLGPEMGFLTMMSLILIQALFFGDGGLIAYGANVFNMAFYSCFIVYPFIFKPLTNHVKSKKRLYVAAIIGTVISLQLGSLSVVLQTTTSGIMQLPFGIFLAAMQPIHLAIGLIEGIITASIVTFVYQKTPHLIQRQTQLSISEKASLKQVVVVIAVMTLITGGLVSWFASDNPDGLEWSIDKVATSEIQNQTQIGETLQSKTAILPDYGFADEGSEKMGKSLSGIFGSLLTVGIISIILLVIKKIPKGNI